MSECGTRSRGVEGMLGCMLERKGYTVGHGGQGTDDILKHEKGGGNQAIVW